jgi:hypothetical protein
MTDEHMIRQRFETMKPQLNERQVRMWVATEARSLGDGGVSAVHRATGVARSTIRRGMDQQDSGQAMEDADTDRIRAAGGGRKRLTETMPGLVAALDKLIDPDTRGDPGRSLQWICKSTGNLADALHAQGLGVSPDTVGRLLKRMGYSLQSTRKRLEGASHPDRDLQFLNISQRCSAMQSEGQPVISVDTKKKELVGDFTNRGREWQPKHEPVPVNVHDFPSLGDGKAVPYGVYDIARNEGAVNVGMNGDTAEFAVQSIRVWWERLGRERYPDARELLITADCGGSNSSRTRLWKTELQGLADQTGLRIRVAHFPPGTSKWNKIEHRLFCHITINWRGRPLTNHHVIVSLIGATTTSAGLRVYAYLDPEIYEKGRKVTDEEMAALSIELDEFHGEWNYVLVPRLD